MALNSCAYTPIYNTTGWCSARGRKRLYMHGGRGLDLTYSRSIHTLYLGLLWSTCNQVYMTKMYVLCKCSQVWMMSCDIIWACAGAWPPVGTAWAQSAGWASHDGAFPRSPQTPRCTPPTGRVRRKIPSCSLLPRPHIASQWRTWCPRSGQIPGNSHSNEKGTQLGWLLHYQNMKALQGIRSNVLKIATARLWTGCMIIQVCWQQNYAWGL